MQFWLLQAADIYMDILGQHFHRRHTFSDFELFWVDVNQKVAPKEH